MNMNKRIREFFSLTRRANAGFTLVELIVVIAILAILAGVAIPVYSGYIKKAETAADNQLLAAVNTAFAAACMQNGVDVRNLTEQPILLATQEKTVAGVSIHNEEFLNYFAGNTGAQFKTDWPVFDSAQGMFIFLQDGATVTLNYNGGKIQVSAEAAQKLKDSSFVQAPGLGVEGLLEKVNFVSDFATLLNNGTYNSILGSDDYKRSFLKALGADPATVDGMNPLQLAGEYSTKLGAMQTQMQSQYPGLTSAQISDKLEANMMVLYAAQNTQNLTTDQITNLLNSDTPKTDILAAATGANISQAALYYGMYTSYAYSTQNTALIEKTGDPVALFNAMTDEETVEFKKYVNSTQGQKDLEAYLASMNIITDATKDNKNGVEGVLTNNFNDPDLIKLFQQVIGG